MKKFFKTPWGISIGTAIFSFLLFLGYDLLKSQPALSTLGSILQAVGTAILAFFNFQLRVWWIIIGIIVLIIAIYIWYKVSDAKEPNRPDFCNYNNDTFQHWRWSWSWSWNDYKKAWTVNELRAHCPQCNTPMIDHSSATFGAQFSCPRCNFHAHDDNCDIPFKVERVILDNLDRKKQEFDR